MLTNVKGDVIGDPRSKSNQGLPKKCTGYGIKSCGTQTRRTKKMMEGMVDEESPKNQDQITRWQVGDIQKSVLQNGL